MSTEQSVEQGNRTIAEFMGKSYQFVEDLKYHSSWDWLMPVIEKIESLGYRFKMCRRRVEVERDTPSPPAGAFDLSIKMIIGSKKETKLQSTWFAVIDFIQWYNNQSKQNED